MGSLYIRAKRSWESYEQAYDSDYNGNYYFVIIQSKVQKVIGDFNDHLNSNNEVKLQFFSQKNSESLLGKPRLVNYYQDYTLSGGATVESKDYYLNKAYNGVTVVRKIPLPDYLLAGYANTAVDYVIQKLKIEPEAIYPLTEYLLRGLGNIALDYGVKRMVGKEYIWEIDKPNRQIKYARNVIDSGWVGSREESTINNSEVTVVATKGNNGKLLRASIIDPKVKIETVSRELLKGLGKEVLDYAIPLIDPEAKDWVLDPANSAVRYTITPASAGGGKQWWSSQIGSSVLFSSKDDLCTALMAKLNEPRPSDSQIGAYTISGNSCQFKWSTGGSYGSVNFHESAVPIEPTDGEYAYIPIDIVSAKVISNAEAGHAESEGFLKSIPLFAYLLTGSGTEAVNKAVLDIDAEATDWVLDPASNRVKYTVPLDDSSAANSPVLFQTGYNGVITKHTTAAAAGGYMCNTFGRGSFNRLEGYTNQTSGIFTVVCNAPSGGAGNVQIVPNPAYNPSAPTTEEKYIPIDTVAQKVVANAESGHVPSQEALRLSTVERVNIGEYDEALEAASIEIDTSWKYLPIYDVAVQVKWNSIAGHAESIEAVNNSLPFELPDNDTPWAYVSEETSVTGSTTSIKAKRTFKNQKLKSSISVAASASKVGGYLIEGGGSDALDYAVVELIGEGVDWVLDPANNAVKYKESGSTDGWQEIAPPYRIFSSVAAACATVPYSDCARSGSYLYANGNRLSVAYLVENIPSDEDKYLPIDTVAAQVISNAEAGHAPSQEAVKATALEGFDAGEHDAALDAAAIIDN